MTLSTFQTASKPDSSQQMRMLRLLHWQLQRLLEPESADEEKGLIEESKRFEVRLRSPIPSRKFSHIKPGVLIQKANNYQTRHQTSRNRALERFRAIWTIDIIESSLDLDIVKRYAAASISNCWLLDINNVELHAYRQPSQSGYGSYQMLQAGDCTSPDEIPLSITLQEPVPLHFLTRTLNGQQTYTSYALPLSFSRELL